MKHLPIKAASAAIPDRPPPALIDDRAHAWIVERGPDGKLEERLDPSFLRALEKKKTIDDDTAALIAAAAKQHVAQTRLW